MSLLMTTGDAIGLLDRLIDKFGTRLIAPNSTESKEFSVRITGPRVKSGIRVSSYTLIEGESEEAYKQRVAKATGMIAIGADISAAKLPQRLRVRNGLKPSVSKVVSELREWLELRDYDTEGRLQQTDVARLVIDLLKHGSSDEEGYLADQKEPPESYKSGQPVGSYCFWTTGYHGDNEINALLAEYELIAGKQMRSLAQVIDELRDSSIPRAQEHLNVLALFQRCNMKSSYKIIDLTTQQTDAIIETLKDATVYTPDYYYGDVIETDKPIKTISDYPCLSSEFYQVFEENVIQPLREKKEEAERTNESVFSKLGRWF